MSARSSSSNAVETILPLIPDDFPHDDPFDTKDPRGGGWARVKLVNVFDERSCFIREIDVFGATMVELRVPARDEGAWSIELYAGTEVLRVFAHARKDLGF